TVGVRARREQAGLTGKTVVTASIGVACREGCELDANLLSAITVAAKHQLGVDANENISILDLRAGKSYFGSETLVGNGEELTLAAEKERVETYWRDKLLKTFDYMGGVRVSVAAELVAVAPDEVVRTELGGVSLDVDGGWKVAPNERAVSAAERLAQVEIGEMGEIKSPRPLATWSGFGEKSARNGGAFARLGNPVATRSAAPVEALNLAEVERRTATGAGVLSVGATERRGDANRAVVPAGYREDAENEESLGNGESEERGQDERGAQTAKGGAVRGSETVARVESVEQDAEKRGKREKRENAEEGKNGKNRSDGTEERRNVESGERVCFRVRALAVRIGTPRGYVRRVAQTLKAENAVETFAVDETAGSWGDFYRSTEQKIIAETKNVALVLLRPLAERNGWNENELIRSVSVDVFADPSDFEAATVDVKTAARRDSGRENVGGSGDEARDAENGSGGPYEAGANFGRFANISEMVAEETTIAGATAEGGEETTLETPGEEPTTLDFWALCKARVRGLDAETKASVGVAGVG
ncbi:MAG: hypothetical protein IJO46_00780, partial [Thermoguttaceae bacterium]|nr:hypothetical protein [Thermoguttaceae bacterium]